MDWTKEDIKEIIAFCKDNNVSQFSWSSYCFEFKLGNKHVYVAQEIEKAPETKLTLEDIEKKKQEDYDALMFMSSR